MTGNSRTTMIQAIFGRLRMSTSGVWKASMTQ